MGMESGPIIFGEDAANIALNMKRAGGISSGHLKEDHIRDEQNALGVIQTRFDIESAFTAAQESGEPTLEDATQTSTKSSEIRTENGNMVTISLAKASEKKTKPAKKPAAKSEVAKEKLEKKQHYDGEVFESIRCGGCQGPTVWSSTAATGGKCICPNCDDSPGRLDYRYGRLTRKRYSGRWKK